MQGHIHTAADYFAAPNILGYQNGTLILETTHLLLGGGKAYIEGRGFLH